MGIGARLKLLREAAEERGPVEPDPRPEDDFDIVPLKVPALPPLNPDEVFSDDPDERARIAGGNAGLDCETKLIQPGRAVPQLIVTGYQATNGVQGIVTGDANDIEVHVRAFLGFTEKIIRDAFTDAKAAKEALAKGDTLRVSGLLVNQNIAFDFSVIAEEAHQVDVRLGLVGKPESWFEAVMQRIFELLDLRLIEDPMLRERLIDLAEGTLGKDFDSVTEEGNPRRKKYGLKPLAQKYLNVELDKLSFRLGYSAYWNKPIEAYPDGAKKYLTDDVESALAVAGRQQERAYLHGLPHGHRIPNSAEQSKAAFAFNLLGAWGVRTDLRKVQQLEADLDVQERRLFLVLKDTGLIRSEGRQAGTRDMKRTKELVAAAYKRAGLEVPMTKSKNGKGGGNISTAGGVLEDIALIELRGSPKDILDEKGQVDETELFKTPLYAYSQYVSIQKLKNTYLPVLFAGTMFPINGQFETLLETGRISMFKPNLTNLPRGGIKTLLQRLQTMVRECFVPRPGFVYSSVDYHVAELCALAQICIWMLGFSKLAEALNNDIDPHLLLAAEQLLNITYEEAFRRKKDKDVADMRQLAKSASFGFPGGLGARTFIDFAKNSYNVYITEDEARVLKEKWLNQWPEMRLYFRKIANFMRGYDEKGQSIGDIEQYISGRIRGRCRYTAACNTLFQGAVADSCKESLYQMQKECYLLGGRMYGARPVVFVHDEIIAEVPEERAEEYAFIQSGIMVKTMQEMCPDVKIKAEPALMRAWYKNAEAVYNRAGHLIPWDPNVKYVKDETNGPARGKMVPRETSFAGAHT